MAKTNLVTRDLLVVLLTGTVASFLGQGVAWAFGISALPRVSVFAPFSHLFNAGVVYAIFRATRASSPYAVAAWLLSLALARGLFLTLSSLPKMNGSSALISAFIVRESLKGLVIYGVIYGTLYAVEAQRRA